MPELTVQTLPQIAISISQASQNIVLDGRTLSLPQIVTCFSNKSRIHITKNRSIFERMNKSYQVMIDNIKQGQPVYGCNTSYGGRANRVLSDGGEIDRLTDAQKLSDALVFLDVGIGSPLPKAIIRAAMVIRVNMLLQGVSGIRPCQLEKLLQMVNHNIIPLVQEHGGIGASGDLIHNQRVISAARGLPGTLAVGVDGVIQEAALLLQKHDIPFMTLQPKEGLALVNGDNFSTAMAAYVANKLMQYFLISITLSAMTIEVLKGSNRSFHPMLAHVRGHSGQKEIADIYRFLLQDSQLAYQELTAHQRRSNGSKVQDAYSLRCLPQFEGIMLEKLKWCLETIRINANSVSDNPLWVPEELTTTNEEPWQWVSGGNFLAMHMAEVLDTLRKITTQLVKKHDRHLARLVDVADSNDLPPNLSMANQSVSHCAFKGIQILSGMLDVHSMLLANPVTTLFGIHEERNQDITSHATTSGNLALKNLELLKYSLAGNLLAVAQAVDLRGGGQLLSPHTRPLYEFIRTHSLVVSKERPLHQDLAAIADRLEDEGLMTILREKIYPNFRSQDT